MQGPFTKYFLFGADKFRLKRYNKKNEGKEADP